MDLLNERCSCALGFSAVEYKKCKFDQNFFSRAKSSWRSWQIFYQCALQCQGGFEQATQHLVLHSLISPSYSWDTRQDLRMHRKQCPIKTNSISKSKTGRHCSSACEGQEEAKDQKTSQDHSQFHRCAPSQPFPPTTQFTQFSSTKAHPPKKNHHQVMIQCKSCCIDIFLFFYAILFKCSFSPVASQQLFCIADVICDKKTGQTFLEYCSTTLSTYYLSTENTPTMLLVELKKASTNQTMHNKLIIKY